MPRLILDLDILHTFVTGVDLGSFAQAADRLGRSTSAVSAQLKKLESQIGAPVLRKQGRGLVLTPRGEILLGYARRLLDLHDEAAGALGQPELAGVVRLGLQEDFGEQLLTTSLGRFARAHPQVRVEARIARNGELLRGIAQGQLDLALAWDIPHGPTPAPSPSHQFLRNLPLCWVGPQGALPWRPEAGPLPLVAFDAPCLMRDMAIRALDQGGIPWRLAFVSPSLAGIWAAVQAGLGIALRTPMGLPPSLRPLGPEDGLPPLPDIALLLHRGDTHPAPAVARLEALLREDLAVQISTSLAGFPT